MQAVKGCSAAGQRRVFDAWEAVETWAWAPAGTYGSDPYLNLELDLVLDGCDCGSRKGPDKVSEFFDVSVLYLRNPW